LTARTCSTDPKEAAMADEETRTLGTNDERIGLGAAYGKVLAVLAGIDDAIAKVRGMSDALLDSLANRNVAMAALPTIEREATERAEQLPGLGNLAEQIRTHLTDTEQVSTAAADLAAILYGAALQLKELRLIWLEKADQLLELIGVAASPVEVAVAEAAADATDTPAAD